MNGYLTLTWSNVKSAAVYGLLTAAAVFASVVGQQIVDAGTFVGLDWRVIVDRGAVAGLGVFVSLVSLVKNLLTNAQGKFLGLVEVIPDKSAADKK